MFHGDTEEAKRINEWLNLQEHNLKGEPIFRLVKANEQFEMRTGTYNEFRGDLFVRTVYGTKRTSKYPHLKELWILEQWFDQSRVQLDTIHDHSGYECIYSFRDKKFNPLPLRLVVIQLIIKAKHEARKSEMLTKSILQQTIDDKERIAFNQDMDVVDTTPVMASLHAGDGLSMYISKNRRKG